MVKAKKMKTATESKPARESVAAEMRVAIMLAGEAHPAPLRTALDAPTLCLPLAWDCTLLDCWQEACAQIGVQELRIVVQDEGDVRPIEYALQMCDHSKVRVASTQIIVEPDSIRDSTETVGRLTEDLGPEEFFLVINAHCLPPVSMSPILSATGNAILGVIGVDHKNDPSGIVAFRRSSFDSEQHKGILDITEPNLEVMSENDDKFVIVVLDKKTRRLIDRASYLDAVQGHQKHSKGELPEYCRDTSVFISDTASIEGACVIEPGVVIEDDAIIYDSVVMAGATICCGAVVTRSVIGRHALIERDAKILRMIEPADQYLRGGRDKGRDRGRNRGQDGWRKSA
ncbi:MAG: hypothetical protein IH891_04410 [Planctomycetes bacterium]|nr:hypothetical protein [Planctomycetota bacterium]